jgi:CheY-like chemotaxis protein
MRVLEVSLRKAGFTVTTAESVKDALDKLELGAPDLIISETHFPDGDGFDLRKRVRGQPEWNEIPFIFLTAEAAIENKIRGLELGVDDYLTKPIYIKEIVTRINILLQKRQRVRFEERRDGRTRFAGRVADMPVVDVIQTIEISRKSGVIQFVGERNRQAAIYFREGRVIDAEAGALQGEDAVYRLLTWSEGDFEVVFRTVRRREVIATSSQGLLMEGMRRLDEWSRLLEQLPPLTHRFEVDAGELAARLGDVPDDNNPILRLIDGKRTLLEVIDGSDVGDLECLQAISRLYFEEMLTDLDHGAPVRHSTGKPGALVEVDSEPHAIQAATPMEGAARDSAEHEVPTVEHTPAVDSNGKGSGPIELTDADKIDDEPDIVGEAPLTSDGELMGTLRPSSLFLIDEAVAAAQAIEPDLFEAKPEDKPAEPFTQVMMAVSPDLADDKPAEREFDPDATPRLEMEHVVQLQASDPMIFEVSDVEVIEDANVQLVMDGVPRAIDKEPSRRVTAADAQPLGREDSGLRMIGSLGHDRAETSGEVMLGALTKKARANTERELVTILPRRITREMQAVSPPADTPEATADAAAVPPVPSSPVEVPKRLPPPPPASRHMAGSGVTRKQTGPGRGAVALLALAGVLAVVAIYLYVTRPAKRGTKKEVDAGEVVGPVVTPLDAAAELDDVAAYAPPDTTVAVTDAPLPAPDAVARAVDAAVVVAPADATPATDPVSRAKQLYDQAFTAIEESNYEKALTLVDQSLKLRRTARSYTLRAQALQRLGRVDEALEALTQAEQTFPSPAIYEARARIFKAAGRREEARAAIEKYLEKVPDRGNTVKLFKQWLEELR